MTCTWEEADFGLMLPQGAGGEILQEMILRGARGQVVGPTGVAMQVLRGIPASLDRGRDGGMVGDDALSLHSSVDVALLSLA